MGIAECALDNGAEKVYSIDMSEPGTAEDDEFVIVSKKYPGRLLSVVADVTKEASITDAINKIVDEAGAIHGVVVNAGRTNHTPALDFSEADIHALFAVNVGG